MPERRSSDPLILEMHGYIQILLERTKTMTDVQREQNEKFDKQDKRITKNEGAILGMKWVGGLLALIFGGVLRYFDVRK